MKQTLSKPDGGNLRLVVAILFFAALAAFTWLYIRTDLIYTAFGSYLDYPVFALDRPLIIGYLSRPGGPVACLAAMLGQFYYYPWAGAAIITAVAIIMSLALDRLIAAASERPAGPLPVVILPALAMVAIAGRYQFALQGPLAVALVMPASLAYQRMQLVTAKGRISVFIVIFAMLYWLTGSAAMVFALVIALETAICRTQPFGGAPLIVLAGIVTWCLGVEVHHLTPLQAFTLNTPFDVPPAMADDAVAVVFLAAIYLMPPVLFAAVAIARRLTRKRDEAPTQAKGGKKKRTAKRLKFAAMLTPVSVVVLAAATVLTSTDHDRRNLFKALNDMRGERWSEALTVIGRIPLGSYDFFTNHMANRAMYHLGRLPEQMCSVAQGRPALLLATTDVGETPVKFSLLSQTCMDLGDLNLAQKTAYELLESQGPCPSNLENLALIHLAKDQPQTARLLLKALRKDIIHHRRASEMLARIDKDPTMADHPTVRAMRSRRINSDRCLSALAEDELCTALLEATPSNRMAFEYLMSFYLLTKQLDKFAAAVPLLSRLGYTSIGANYQEAILIYSSMNRQQLQIAPLTISPGTIERYRRFTARYKSLGADRQRAFAPMAAEFGDSYFFYYIFGACGLGKG